MSSRTGFYILFIRRQQDGSVKKVSVPLRYAYMFVAAAAIGMFTIAGLAGSYSRMLIKTSRFNQLRQQNQSLQKDYATLETQARQKDVQAASLGALAGEVSALYGLTAGKLNSLHAGGVHSSTVATAAPLNAPLKGVQTANFNNESYYKSVDAFYTLRSSAMSGDTTRILSNSSDPGRFANPLMPGHLLRGLGAVEEAGAVLPSLWPVTGPITSSFGQRDNPFSGGNDEGEFHPGIDISGPLGTPIHVTADGVVTSAEVVNGYGRMVTVDHGHGVETLYGHMSGFAVAAGQTVSQGQVIGYIGHTGRTTGNHVHYEVRIHNTPVNPHKYLRTTLAELGSTSVPAS